ncbi:MAG: hypothetical protein COT74_05940 [Bdellovibrionales bacterium CG10_big_fil_rev_8_21_14_0_10_45_34]|nr:MAG: hypothetical protein COT74_05940 [Bdellovibrionales bacterium CG10_big_fil_rev_8_21_14_0_10_45_34]
MRNTSLIAVSLLLVVGAVFVSEMDTPYRVLDASSGRVESIHFSERQAASALSAQEFSAQLNQRVNEYLFQLNAKVENSNTRKALSQRVPASSKKQHKNKAAVKSPEARFQPNMDKPNFDQAVSHKDMIPAPIPGDKQSSHLVAEQVEQSIIAMKERRGEEYKLLAEQKAFIAELRANAFNKGYKLVIDEQNLKLLRVEKLN